jgi:hypothetical protein
MVSDGDLTCTEAKRLATLRDEFYMRLDQLEDLGEGLSRHAHALSNCSRACQVSLILLGAIIAAKGQLQILPDFKAWSDGFLTILGVLVAVISGLQAAFRFTVRSQERKKFSSHAQTAALKMRARWLAEIGEPPSASAHAAAQALIKEQAEVMSKLLQEDADADVNVARAVRHGARGREVAQPRQQTPTPGR